MNRYLWSNGILLKDFGAHVESVSQAIKAASLAQTLRADRPVRYLSSPDASKEEIARRVAAEDHITDGRGVHLDLRRTVLELSSCFNSGSAHAPARAGAAPSSHANAAAEQSALRQASQLWSDW